MGLLFAFLCLMPVWGWLLIFGGLLVGGCYVCAKLCNALP